MDSPLILLNLLIVLSAVIPFSFLIIYAAKRILRNNFGTFFIITRNIFAGLPGEPQDYPNVWREHAIQDGHKKICEYKDRIGRPSSKDMDKRKDPASSIR
jgi:hypothetical protein